MCKNCKDDGMHEFVGMDMCIYCMEPKQLLLQTKFHKNANGEMVPNKGIRRQQATSPEPCDKCKEKFKEQGIVPIVEATKDEHGLEYGKRYFMAPREAIHGEEFERMIEKVGFLIMPPEDMDEVFANYEAQHAVKN